MAKELIGTIKAEGMEGRTELWAVEKGDNWQIVVVTPNGDQQETEFKAKSSIEALLVVCNQWGTEEWDLRLADEM
ncbi:MAG: hypothetical protein ACOX0F_13035 [Syntrophomonadaceae bacterium]|jgi:hypothetical protein